MYLGYRVLKSWISHNMSSSETIADPKTREIDDIMVKDPFCNVYFAKKEGVHLKVDGKDLYFCSTKCRDQFMASKTKPK
jgi:YHS domain-containing protein